MKSGSTWPSIFDVWATKGHDDQLNESFHNLNIVTDVVDSRHLVVPLGSAVETVESCGRFSSHYTSAPFPKQELMHKCERAPFTL